LNKEYVPGGGRLQIASILNKNWIRKKHWRRREATER
jgi:hypothetical protein